MIEIKDKKGCVGCGACEQRCPVSCITMQEDEQGFLYAKADVKKCIACGLCEKVCPVINQSLSCEPIDTYAGWNKDVKKLKSSSSGGIFIALAQRIINVGGVVFGARFNEKYEVEHGFTRTMNGLLAFQGSKYVQSRIGASYIQAEQFLKKGIHVMFTGTPCQIAGLKLFLRRDYLDLLLTVDVACHSVPSPKVWESYLSTFNSSEYDTIDFRDKKNGWLEYGFSLSKGNKRIFYQKKGHNMYMRGFLADLYSRPSCFACPAKSGKSRSDITIADFWGIWKVIPKMDCKKGISAVIVRTPQGQKAINELSDIELVSTNYSDMVLYNSALENSAKCPHNSLEFWQRFPKEGFKCVKDILSKMQVSFAHRVFRLIKRKLKF